ncbi:uncharacterized protein CIMG_01775 [Coccidioides immitis RS]|uniref:Uncharacterized protein n=1 Tax=Coccidioides immitis (strain RS) TaxID=246410 RepID=A0A0E1S0J3_COCIM|nr:uncharacterized protein CIMG_01775 [Coccidioides immitis RS]EAS36421.2 hypothetical protein CIMG_01775 [Coccidioides immitis RS]
MKDGECRREGKEKQNFISGSSVHEVYGGLDEGILGLYNLNAMFWTIEVPLDYVKMPMLMFLDALMAMKCAGEQKFTFATPQKCSPDNNPWLCGLVSEAPAGGRESRETKNEEQQRTSDVPHMRVHGGEVQRSG